MPEELELKFLASPEVANRVRRSRIITKLARGRSNTRELISVYFDTPDHRLFYNGLSLRIRKTGRHIVQSVKTRHAEDKSGLARFEDEAILSDATPVPRLISDPNLRQKVLDAIGGRDLTPIFASDVQRTTRILYPGEGSQIEMAIDDAMIRPLNDANGEVSENQFGSSFCEIELELKAGGVKDVLKVGRALVQQYPLALSALTKADRGFAIAARKREIFDAVTRTRAHLESDHTVDDAFRDILAECLNHIQANLPAALSNAPEGTHQMRVALRRFRSVVSNFRVGVKSRHMNALANDARALAARLGSVRDYDVFLDEIAAPVIKAVDDDSIFTALIAAVDAARGAARLTARSTLTGSDFTRFVLDLAIAIEERPWTDTSKKSVKMLDRPVTELAGQALDARLKTARKLGGRLDELSKVERHELRKVLKKLRYAGDFFAPLFGKSKAKAYLKRLAELQDVFGYLNDVATAEAIIGNLSISGGDNIGYAGGVVIGWHTHRFEQVWQTTRERWRQFDEAEPFWL